MSDPSPGAALGTPGAPGQLCACGIAASSDAPRCRACPQAAARAAATVPVYGVSGAAPTRHRVSLPPLPHQVPHSRWAKSHTSFGPTGRIVATVLLCLPLVVFGFTIASGVGIIGAGIWVFVVMPWALRDIWKKAPMHGTRS